MTAKATEAPMKRPTAASVSRALAKAGFERSRYLRSARVKNWGHSTEGFTVESEFDHPETIHVRHVFGDWHRGEFDVAPFIEKYAVALRALGYSGEINETSWGRKQFTVRPETPEEDGSDEIQEAYE